MSIERASLAAVLLNVLLSAVACSDNPAIVPTPIVEPTPTVVIQVVTIDSSESDSRSLTLETIPTATPELFTEEERQNLLAMLQPEERTMMEQLTLPELNCLGVGLKGQIDTETPTELAGQLRVYFAQTWDSCIDSTRAADILLGVVEGWNGELSLETRECIREDVRQNYIAHPDSGYRAYAASAWSANVCLTDAEDLEGEISLFALSLGGPITANERACLRKVAREPNASLYGAVDGIHFGRSEHPAFDCFTRERLVEFRIRRFSSRFDTEELADAELNCVRQAFNDAEDIRENLSSEEERTGAHTMFDASASFGCLSADTLVASGMFGTQAGLEIHDLTQCMGPLFREQFPKLYREEVGPRMFGDPESLTTQEKAAMASFEARLGECLPEGV